MNTFGSAEYNCILLSCLNFAQENAYTFLECMRAPRIVLQLILPIAQSFRLTTATQSLFVLKICVRYCPHLWIGQRAHLPYLIVVTTCLLGLDISTTYCELAEIALCKFAVNGCQIDCCTLHPFPHRWVATILVTSPFRKPDSLCTNPQERVVRYIT